MDRIEIAEHIVDRLNRDRGKLAVQWRNPEGAQTRHVYIDRLLPEAVARSVYDGFPPSGEGFFDRDSFREKKKTLTDLSGYPAIVAETTYALQSPLVIAAFAKIAGLERLVPDPSLYAAGLSMMFRGDFLNPHIDNSHDAGRVLYRRLNFLYYVSPDWSSANGGSFQLWDPSVRRPKAVEARFNRLLIMETNRTSWHSVSPVTSDRPRCCVSTYVFSRESQDLSEYFHVTRFTGRPGQAARRARSILDNALRQFAARTFKLGRGRRRTNPSASRPPIQQSAEKTRNKDRATER
jgi:Rps23 Pro-64 3,4-dihydroxylase Tpa1-like proline 4-hydroxylase